MAGPARLPGVKPYEKAHALAFEQAAAAMRAADLATVARQTAADLHDSTLTVAYFGERCSVRLPEVAFEPPGISLRDQVLLLHYLTARGAPAGGSYVTFKSLPGGMFYDGPFRRRSIERILGAFRGRPAALFAAAEAIGGQRWNLGDASVRLQALPAIDVVAVLYDSDDEFPPEANLLFSDNAAAYLDLEDIATLGTEVASRLCAARPRAPAAAGESP
jgi:hypothetical protein